VKKAVLVMIALSLAVLPLGGCAGKSSELKMEDTTVVPPATRTIVFPNGTVFGGASRQQATKLAQIFVESHNMAMKQRAEFQRALWNASENSRTAGDRRNNHLFPGKYQQNIQEFLGV
jgi:hypothetical protein